jgi:pimeloyl-ACP methyl ester carboxylesterase
MEPILLPLLERGVRRALVRHGFESSRVATSLGKVHVYDAAGSGPMPTIVLLHGISASATSFAPLMLHLRSRARRLVAIDYPGHGFSDEPGERLTPERLMGRGRRAAA